MDRRIKSPTGRYLDPTKLRKTLPVLTRKEAVATNTKMYVKEKPCRNGHKRPVIYHDGCLECRQRDYKKYNNNIRRNNTLAWMFRRAKQRAKSKGWEFNLTLDDLIMPATCPLLGIPISNNFGNNMFHANSPTIDRIDNTKGYVKGNVWIISYRANMIKNDASFSEFETIYMNWRARNGGF